MLKDKIKKIIIKLKKGQTNLSWPTTQDMKSQCLGMK
jgi:hypothetical protein